jgi:hypothetical protein
MGEEIIGGRGNYWGERKLLGGGRKLLGVGEEIIGGWEKKFILGGGGN